jgi:hypothetical protein
LFPVLSISKFFKEPDKIRDWALSLDYTSSETGDWPGVRSKALHEIDAEWADVFFSKFLSSYYNFHLGDDVRFNVQAHFQKLTPHKNQRCNQGWTHMDNNTVLAGLVYLTPNANKDAGTSLFVLDEGKDAVIDSKIKQDFYLGKEVDLERYTSALEEYNSRFTETTRFVNNYNTLISYPGDYYHRANNFGDGERLTLVFFIEQLSAPYVPLEKVDSFKF